MKSLISNYLTLPNNAFWVNLNPGQPDMITDKQLGKTNVGKIMREADLQSVQIKIFPDN